MPDLSRRDAIRAGVGAAALGGVASTASASPPGFGGWFEKTENYDGIVDETGKDEVTVAVGPEDVAGGPYAFAPAAVRVDPGTTVTWTWKSNTHNVVVESQPDGAGWTGTEGGASTYYDAGHTYSHTFETTGVYKYFCQPHKTLGMNGVVIVGDAGPGGGGGGGKTKTVAVGPGGDLAFAPKSVEVPPGTTVKWVWKSNNHNVVVSDQPDGADWTGTAGGPSKLYDEGHTYSHTFETTGTYEYYCEPHRAAGMKGSVTVSEDATLGGDKGSGFTFRPTPEIGLLGGAAIMAFLSPLIFGAFLWAKDLGGDAGDAEVGYRPGGVETGPDYPTTEVAAEREPAREIDHESFTPRGTATLVFVYFLILVAMWAFMYFVEFLGNGPTVIG